MKHPLVKLRELLPTPEALGGGLAFSVDELDLREITHDLEGGEDRRRR